MRRCWGRVVIKGKVNNSCGCVGDSAVSMAFLKSDVMTFQYFTVPPLFLSDSSHSSGIWWNGTGIQWIPPDSAGFHWTPLE